MEDINREKIIERIKQLFALGDSSRNPNEGEVKTALRMAKKLMAKYNLSLSEIEIKESGESCIIELNSNEFKHFRGWETRLANIAAKLFKVRLVIGASHGMRLRNMIFVGYRVDAELAQKCFSYLLYTVRVMSSTTKGRISRGAYRDGIIDRLNQRVEEELILDAAMKEKCRAIVIAKDSMIKSWMKENMNLRDKKAVYRDYKSQDIKSYCRGVVDANNIDLMNRRKMK